MSEITGKIEWLAETVKEFPAGSGDLNIGMKVKSAFYNLYGEKDMLEKMLTTLKKGFEVKLTVTGNKIDKLEILSDVVADKDKSFADDLTTFEELLDDAHKKYVTDTENMSIETELIENDWEKQRAIFKAKVTVSDGSLQRVFEAYGDATQDNVGDIVKKHYIRMAETRAIARALRWATNNAKTAEEECEHGKVPEEPMSQEEMIQAQEEELAKP